ncbi:AAA domain-containing protein [Fulvivirga maritima]|uniref:AAA domain-containing protein n=1 Tax=Fulvivirga maritima TaxID=2904247 RepID=UPI001F1795D4|nr:AAA domain-containing protein [Fulvivirga maritima]UII25338.1 AAA domain-containing protein [Fulvivirga maritima]
MVSSQLSKAIHYFFDCYRSDNRELSIFDFLDNKVENRLIIEGREELLTGDAPIIPIEDEVAVSIRKKLEVYQKEKELLYAAFFVCGYYTNTSGEQKRLCSPLVYYNAEIEQREDFYYLSVKPDSRKINYPLVNLLTESGTNDQLYDQLHDRLPHELMPFDKIAGVIELCNNFFDQVDAQSLYGYPDNLSLKEIKKVISSLKSNKAGKLKLVPASMLGVVAKSSNTRGVLNELKEMITEEEYSAPLQYLLDENPAISSTSGDYIKGRIPVILSEAQQVILKSGAEHPVTMIVGPPGTGKSYTIGALAIEHMSRGESVLIASRTDEAVDVIISKVASQLGIDRCVIRGGRKRRYLTPLMRFLKALLSRANKLRYLIEEFGIAGRMDAFKLAKRITELKGKLQELEEDTRTLEESLILEVDNEMRWGDYLSKEREGLWNWLKTEYLDLRNRYQTPVWKISERLGEADEQKIEQTLELIKLKYVFQILEVLEHNWNDIKQFREGLGLASDTETLKLFSKIDFKAILKAFPIWAVTMADVKDVLPFTKEMFDVVIIDEATQCDIASCLPLMQRAKRVVFAGDPCQLKHVSFLSTDLQTIFREKHGLQAMNPEHLNDRSKSILDLVMSKLHSGDQIAMLDEHFRSVEPIIAFSNQQFYDNNLHIMTSRPDHQPDSIVMEMCEGKREKRGYNEKEASLIIKRIRTLIDEEEGLEAGIATSVGILSPFRGQVDYLGELLVNAFTISEIEKHQLRVGTAYSFQGEERDIMHLSFAVDKDTHHSAFIHLNKEDVFNVSITRARQRQYLYLSIKPEELKKESLFSMYVQSVNKQRLKYQNEDAELHDRFLDEVSEALTEAGINEMWPNYQVAGLSMDLLLKKENRYIGVDLIGFPGAYESAYGVERYRILHRAGIKVFPLPYSDWYFEREETLKALNLFINN